MAWVEAKTGLGWVPAVTVLGECLLDIFCVGSTDV